MISGGETALLTEIIKDMIRQRWHMVGFMRDSSDTPLLISEHAIYTDEAV